VSQHKILGGQSCPAEQEVAEEEERETQNTHDRLLPEVAFRHLTESKFSGQRPWIVLVVCGARLPKHSP
jgi:hypothetical protein